MTKEEYRAAMDDVIYLASCMVNEAVPDAGRAAEMNLDRLYAAADRHMLTGIIGYALESAGIRHDAFYRERMRAVRNAVLFDAERKAVLDKLEEAGIWYMPLKGIVLKELYPKIGMRQMADNDILYDVSRCDDLRVIMESLGFEAKTHVMNDYDHDCFEKLPIFNFEMHRALIHPGPGKAIFKYYRNAKDRLIKDDGNAFGYHFSDEDFYTYMVTHEYKHFDNGGTGLRSVLDTYIYCTRKGGQLDWKYIERELKKLGLYDFERANRSLALHLFGGEELTDDEKEMLEYIIFSGTYGTQKNYVQNGLRKKGRVGFLISRTFLPYSAMVSAYPILHKLPFLLPVFWVVRIVSALFSKPKKVMYQLLSSFRKIEK